jgi:DNA end-binding protein Ku
MTRSKRDPRDSPGRSPATVRGTYARTPESRRGFTQGGIDMRKSKAALYEDAADAGIEGRSKMSKAELVHALERTSDRETARARS